MRYVFYREMRITTIRGMSDALYDYGISKTTFEDIFYGFNPFRNIELKEYIILCFALNMKIDESIALLSWQGINLTGETAKISILLDIINQLSNDDFIRKDKVTWVDEIINYAKRNHGITIRK